MVLSILLQNSAFRHINMDQCILLGCDIAELQVQLESMAMSILGTSVEIIKDDWRRSILTCKKESVTINASFYKMICDDQC